MITFKQFLSEARMAPLYHSTSIDGLQGMIHDGIMKRGWPDDDHPHSKDGKIISMTRDFYFATKWKSIVLQFDQRKLTQRYKVVPFNYFPYEGARKQNDLGGRYKFTNQYEESVLQDVKDPLKYVMAIYVQSPFSQEQVKKIMPDKYKDIPVLLQKEFKKIT